MSTSYVLIHLRRFLVHNKSCFEDQRTDQPTGLGLDASSRSIKIQIESSNIKKQIFLTVLQMSSAAISFLSQGYSFFSSGPDQLLLTSLLGLHQFSSHNHL